MSQKPDRLILPAGESFTASLPDTYFDSTYSDMPLAQLGNEVDVPVQTVGVHVPEEPIYINARPFLMRPNYPHIVGMLNQVRYLPFMRGQFDATSIRFGLDETVGIGQLVDTAPSGEPVYDYDRGIYRISAPSHIFTGVDQGDTVDLALVSLVEQHVARRFAEGLQQNQSHKAVMANRKFLYKMGTLACATGGGILGGNVLTAGIGVASVAAIGLGRVGYNRLKHGSDTAALAAHSLRRTTNYLRSTDSRPDYTFIGKVMEAPVVKLVPADQVRDSLWASEAGTTLGE